MHSVIINDSKNFIFFQKKKKKEGKKFRENLEISLSQSEETPTNFAKDFGFLSIIGNK